MNANLAVEKLDLQRIRERFTTIVENLNKDGWNKVLVKVFDSGDLIFEYTRNYSMLKTFEPFRVWDEVGLEWRNFALVSPNYTATSLLDLDKRKLLGNDPPPPMPLSIATTYNEKYLKEGNEPYKEGDPWHSVGFCPMEFYVPDFLDFYDEQDMQEFHTDYTKKEMKIFLSRRNFGFVGGCIWGDDSSMKVRSVDLTKVLDGQVKTEEKFGYTAISKSLQDSISVENYLTDEHSGLRIDTPIYIHLNDDQEVGRVFTECTLIENS